MSGDRKFSDEELTAFLDGEAEHTPMAEIERALESDAEIRARLDALRIERDALKRAFDGLLNAAPAMPAQQRTARVHQLQTPPRAKSSGWFPTAMAAMLALGIGFGGGYLLRDRLITSDGVLPPVVQKKEGWRARVANYQDFYGQATLAAVNLSDTEAQAQLEMASQALGKKFDLSTLRSSAALEYKRGQVLHLNGKPLIQLAFVAKSGAPVALCIVKAKPGAKPDLRYKEFRGMKSASWAKNGFDYFLIGGADQALIEETAKVFKDTI